MELYRPSHQEDGKQKLVCQPSDVLAPIEELAARPDQQKQNQGGWEIDFLGFWLPFGCGSTCFLGAVSRQCKDAEKRAAQHYAAWRWVPRVDLGHIFKMMVMLHNMDGPSGLEEAHLRAARI